jgi:hypothetical protein
MQISLWIWAQYLSNLEKKVCLKRSCQNLRKQIMHSKFIVNSSLWCYNEIGHLKAMKFEKSTMTTRI